MTWKRKRLYKQEPNSIPPPIIPFTFEKSLDGKVWKVINEKGEHIDSCAGTARSKAAWLDHWKKRYKREYLGDVPIDDTELTLVSTSTGRRAWVQKGMEKKKRDQEIERRPKKAPTVWKYHTEIGQEVCEMVAAGHTLSEIARIPGYPPTIAVYAWKQTHREFRENLKEALANRAHTLRDKMIDTANEAADSSDVPVAKLKIDTYKWAAEKDNPTDFGPVTRQDQLPTQPITIMIDTGINRSEIIVQSNVLEQRNDSAEVIEGITDGSNNQAEIVSSNPPAEPNSGGDSTGNN